MDCDICGLKIDDGLTYVSINFHREIKTDEKIEVIYMNTLMTN